MLFQNRAEIYAGIFKWAVRNRFGKAIKQLNLPRAEIVVMTKVNTNILHLFFTLSSSTGFLHRWNDRQHLLLGG